MILCELCGGTTDDRMNASGWGWCGWCQHGTHNIEYSDVAATYQTDNYAGHNGDFQFLKTQWTTNVEQLKKHVEGSRVEGRESSAFCDTLNPCPLSLDPRLLTLDIGFLEGAGMAAMLDAGFDVHGFDVSQAAFIKAVSNGIEPNRLQIASEFSFEIFGEAAFVAVTCREVIEHVAAPDALLLNIARLLRPSGIAQIQTPVFDEKVRFWACAEHLRCYSTGSLITVAERSGLRFIDSLLWPGGMCLTFCKKDSGFRDQDSVNLSSPESRILNPLEAAQ